MNKIAQYLQEHVAGEILTNADARRYFATDGSIFTLVPSLVLYPRSENDVRKTARFTWQLAERNRIVPITARGGGSDQSGAAIGSGIIMVFPAHLNRIVELDAKSGVVTVEPGTNYSTLQQTLQTHGRFLPPAPASAAYTTLGGAVANNAGSAKSVKYGDTRGYVKRLRVVLANGEAIETGRLGKRELSRKLGLASFEGEIYRALDTLLEDEKAAVAHTSRVVVQNAAGYDLADVKHKDGSFDLTPLFVGSQGTLGIITEITLETELHNPETGMIIAHFDDAQHLQAAVLALRQAADMPSAIEVIDGQLLELAAAQGPAQLKRLAERPYPQFVLLVEYDDVGRGQKRTLKKGAKLLERHAVRTQIILDKEDQEELWRLRELSAVALAHMPGNARALPLIEDGAVPVEQLGAFLSGLYNIFSRHHLQIAVWGHAGTGNMQVRPHLDLSQVGDRQRVFKLMEEYYALVTELGGTTTAQHGDGRLRGPFLEKLYGQDVYALFQKVKKIFDPYGTLNPGVKIGVTLDDIKPLLRQEYATTHTYQHLPRS